jgi:thioesterase domain-containing protein/acyl carrier protein
MDGANFQVTTLGQSEAILVPPRNDLERRILAIWTEVLEHDFVGVTDNFYDVGGDSLRAVQVISQIENEFAISLPPSRLYDAATVEKQALVLQADPADLALPLDESLVVEIRPSESGKPLFCFPGNCGGVSPFYPLGERIGTENGVSVVLYSYLERNTPTPTMKDLAASCLQGVKSVQPAGPYHLTGYCFGASVAYEVARQLQAAGEEVATLALLDPEPGFASWPVRKQIATRTREFTAQVRSYVAWRLAGGRRVAKPAVAPAEPLPVAPTEAVASPAEASIVAPSKPKSGLSDKIAHFQKAAHAILQSYKHRPYEGRFTIFHSASGHNPPELSYWRSLARGEFEEHRVPGNHFTMLQEPHVASIAEILRKAFQQT